MLCLPAGRSPALFRCLSKKFSGCARGPTYDRVAAPMLSAMGDATRVTMSNDRLPKEMPGDAMMEPVLTEPRGGQSAVHRTRTQHDRT